MYLRTVPSLDGLGLLAETDGDRHSLGLRGERHGEQREEERDALHVVETIAKRPKTPQGSEMGALRLRIPLDRFALAV